MGALRNGIVRLFVRLSVTSLSHAMRIAAGGGKLSCQPLGRYRLVLLSRLSAKNRQREETKFETVKTSVSETIRKPPLVKSQTALGKQYN